MRILNYFFPIIITISLNNFLYGNNDYIVETSSGITYGKVNKGVITWHDIPYAKPPVGDLRWRAPQTLKNTSQIIENKENNFCVQRPSSLGGATGIDNFVGTENCLYLDIRKPKNSSEILPVMFWIHGGGNTSGLKDLYDFSGLVKNEKVIVVSINYRLGPFGWLSHPAIQDFQDGLDKTSNFGTLDIIKALEWVNENIAKFGGDKNNITIFGESAGGHNVLSLLVAPLAKGLFHKAISQSGYTTSITYETAFNEKHENVDYINSNEVVTKIFGPDKELSEIRMGLKSLSAYEFYKYYSNDPFKEIPLTTNDGIIIPMKGILDSLKEPLDKSISVIAGSNRDEIKLWIATSLYFVKAEYSLFGSFFRIPRVKIVNEDAFEAFNYYRSSAWQIRGVTEPLNNLAKAGIKNLYSYRFDWDDHRKWPVANFKKLFGAAHATEIPLLTGNTKLVGNYGFLIYPNGPSKRFTSRNMMSFWGNFAKSGKPGSSSNGIDWQNYKETASFLILDNKSNLYHKPHEISFESLIYELDKDKRINDKEKCILMYQLGTLIGNDIYNDLIKIYPKSCNLKESKQFLVENSDYISY